MTISGGSVSGSCASGFGVCCLFSMSCGGVTSTNNTYFKVSPRNSQVFFYTTRPEHWGRQLAMPSEGVQDELRHLPAEARLRHLRGLAALHRPGMGPGLHTPALVTRDYLISMVGRHTCERCLTMSAVVSNEHITRRRHIAASFSVRVVDSP